MAGDTTAAPLRVALLLDAEGLTAWQAKAVELLIADGPAEVCAVMLRIGDRIGSTRGRPGIGSTGYHLYTRRVSRSRALAAGRSPVPGDTPTLRATPTQVKKGLELKPADLEWLSARQPDVLLAFGFDGLRGDALNLAAHGAWAYRHGRGTRSGGPVGFWETQREDPVVSASLVRLADDPSNATILRRGWFAVAPASHGKTRDRVLFGSAGWAAYIARTIRSGGHIATVPVGATGRQNGTPSALAFARFLLVSGRAFAQKLWHHGMRHDDWNIGVADVAAASLPDREDIGTVDWAPTLRGHYAADPFGAREGDGVHVFYEDYAHASGIASIAHRTWRREGGWSTPTVALDIGTHLSYPFLLRRADGWLLMPESRASGALTIYEAATLEGPWEPRAKLDVDPDIADATLLEHDGRWWLFGIRPDRLNPATELAIWFADAPEGPWQPHPANPVVIDVRCARPAGPVFEAGGRLIRPAQDCSTGYGDRLTLRQIRTLTPDRYEEETVGTLEPEREGAFPYGLHTLTDVDGLVLVDGKRRVWDTAAFVRAIRGRLPF